jgi:hypothetical protein
MSLFRIGLAVAALGLATLSAADARDKDGYLEPAENPLLGTWLLSAEGINPNMPIWCGVLRMTFTQSPRTYIQFRPNAVAAGQRIYTILDHDHIMLDEIPRCTYQRGPLNGTTPLLDSINAEAEAKRQSAAEPPMPPPSTPTQQEVQRQIDEMANPSQPHRLTYDEAIHEINKLPPAEAGPPAVPSPISTSPELQRSMSQLNQAIRELQERARQQAPP